MEHTEATQQMAAERYLLNELSQEEREAFEEHVFGCPECALDLRAGSVFITEAKAQLPEIASQAPPTPQTPGSRNVKRKNWSFWFPVFAVPAFAALLAVIAYEDLAIIPALRKAANEPRIMHSMAIHLGTRGSAHLPVQTDRTEGLALSIGLPQSSAYSSFVFELYDPMGKAVWTHTVNGSTMDAGDDGDVSLVIPGPGLREGPYTLEVSGVTSQGGRVEVDRRVLDIRFNH